MMSINLYPSKNPVKYIEFFIEHSSFSEIFWLKFYSYTIDLYICFFFYCLIPFLCLREFRTNMTYATVIFVNIRNDTSHYIVSVTLLPVFSKMPYKCRLFRSLGNAWIIMQHSRRIRIVTEFLKYYYTILGKYSWNKEKMRDSFSARYIVCLDGG